MSKYLAEELARGGVDDEAIVEYCVGLLDDGSMDAGEKEEAIGGYLESATETDFGAVVRRAIELAADERRQREAETQQQAAAARQLAQERERAELQRDAQGGAQGQQQQSGQQKQLSAEERRQREHLLKTYGFQEPEIVEGRDGEAEIVYRDTAADRAELPAEINDNAARVAEKERAMRESSRLAHQKKVEREKELLEKDRLRKEKERRRTMKNEKRRM
ncbi:hypothetical protein H4R18_002840 [Coemansia javaensis]|uniref:Coiled-coil domain-containing protein 43 n=1 Tax=Coemansia javaensis TaxID=2761396 RepID=A0A9W8HDY3_9FUNG|nr:hypothetical protein H4R18_002840 [Coemansia javaensis]